MTEVTATMFCHRSAVLAAATYVGKSTPFAVRRD